MLSKTLLGSIVLFVLRFKSPDSFLSSLSEKDGQESPGGGDQGGGPQASACLLLRDARRSAVRCQSRLRLREVFRLGWASELTFGVGLEPQGLIRPLSYPLKD